jgi:hypothetical protein
MWATMRAVQRFAHFRSSDHQIGKILWNKAEATYPAEIIHRQ